MSILPLTIDRETAIRAIAAASRGETARLEFLAVKSDEYLAGRLDALLEAAAPQVIRGVARFDGEG